ncbi:MAG: ATP-binding protein, partial [Actinomycetota bacterium]
MSFPIRARLTVWYGLLLAGILVGVGVFLLVRLQADLLGGVDDSLATRAAQISLGLRNGCEGEFADVSDASLRGLPQGESGAQLLSPNGSVLESSGDAISARPLLSSSELRRVMSGDRLFTTIARGADAESFRTLAVALPTGCDAAVVVSTSLDEVERSAHSLLVLMEVGIPVAVAAAAAGAWWLAGLALRPVSSMTEKASAIGPEHLDERIEVPQTSDEIQRLATTLNSMLDRVQSGVEEKRRFVADASHELRTPLAIMRSELDVSLRDRELSTTARAVLQSSVEEVDRMTVTVENLLTLARMDEGGMQLDRRLADLHEVARSVLDSVRPLSEGAHVRLELSGNSVEVPIDRERVEQVLTNLLSNAIRYSGEGGEVDVRTWTNGREAGLSVSDTGPGIPDAMQSRIFERFVRVDASRRSDGGGAGLGLAISKEIVDAHGGRIWLERQDGGGSRFL